MKAFIKSIPRLLSLGMGLYMLWCIYTVIRSYFTKTFLIAGLPGTITDLLQILLIISIITIYALYYAIKGRTLFGGVFQLILILFSIGFLIAAGYLVYTKHDIERLYIAYVMSLLACLFAGYVLFKSEWKYKKRLQQFGARTMIYIGLGLLIYIFISFFVNNTDLEYESIAWITGFTIMFWTMFFAIDKNSQPLPVLNIPDNFIQGDSIQLGAWVDYVWRLNPDEQSLCLTQMAKEAKINVNLLNTLASHQYQAGIIEELEINFTTVQFYGGSIFDLSIQTLRLLFQPLPIFLVKTNKITTHRSLKIAIQCAKSKNDYRIFDALGYEYQQCTKPSILHNPYNVTHKHDGFNSKRLPQAQELKNLLSSYLIAHRANVPANADLSFLVNMMIVQIGYDPYSLDFE